MHEEKDDDLPVQYLRLPAHLQTGSAAFNRRPSAHLTDHVDQDTSNSYVPQYPDAPQSVHNDSDGRGNSSSPPQPFSATQHGHPDPEGVAKGHQRSHQPPSRTITPLINETPSMSHATPMIERATPSIDQGSRLTRILNDIANPDINKHQLEYTPQQSNEIIIRQQQHQRRQAEINLQHQQRHQRMQNGSSNPQIFLNEGPPVQNFHQLAQQSQARNENKTSLQRQQNAQIQIGKVTHGIPDEGSPAQHPQGLGPSQQNQYQQVKPKQSLEIIEKRYSDQQNYLPAASEIDHPRGASKDYPPESGPKCKTTAMNNRPFHLNSVLDSSQELLEFLASTPPPSPPLPGTRTEPGTPAIASAGNFFNRPFIAAENRGAESSSPPPFVFGRGSGSMDGPPRAQTGDNSTDSEFNTSIDMLEGSSRLADADIERRSGRAAPLGRCHSCNRAQTPEWRRGPDGERTLCNACGLRMCIPHLPGLELADSLQITQG